MEKYEQLSIVGEGSYGLVIKCKHKESDQMVAIKKFVETEEDATVRRMALREIRMLKKLRHENLVAMIEVFRHKKRFYLVFEYVEATILNELERMPNGLGDDRCRERIYQVIRAVNYCHMNHVIHRDVKPENVLISSKGVVKLCDFGFARLVSLNGEACTEYVATRWYRAPELLVGEANYGPAVDVWAIGCLFAEMMSGNPIFPGDSDIDQLYIIIKMIGRPCLRHQQIMSKNTQLRGMIRSSSSGDSSNLYKQYPRWPLLALDFLSSCIRMDPQTRPTTEDLLRHNYFNHDKFPQKFLPALREKVLSEYNSNPLLRRYKADILISSEKKEMKRISTHYDQPPRWKISLADANIKRKLCYETVNQLSIENCNSLTRQSNQRFAVRKDEQDFVKKSPNVNKSSFMQGTLPKNFFKRIDYDAETTITPLWLGGGNNKKKQEFVKLRNDDFCLPNVPGATTSPQKQKKKPQTMEPITPSFRYEKAKRKYHERISLPVL